MNSIMTMVTDELDETVTYELDETAPEPETSIDAINIP
jgi:hypothetical protein